MMYFLLILLLSIFIFLSNSTQLNATLNEQPIVSRITSRVVQFEYIVTFTTYMSIQAQREVLNSIMGNKGWEYIDRKNPSVNFPSDFALVKFFSHPEEEKFINLLKSQTKIVKRIFPQHQYTGFLKEYTDTPYRFEGRFHSKFPEYRNNFLSKRLLQEEPSIADLFSAKELWKDKITGKGVSVAIFDTGLKKDHPHFRNISETYDMTNEDTKEDHIGHGTFVAGVVASSQSCLGFAPDATIYSFRVFTSKQVSFTTWFLDAFNTAMHLKINILNLSIGGPDFNDIPFVDKVMEVSANNIVVVSAIGNDGPVYGTLNNPADQLDVIGVGGITFTNQLSRFSSRGMTTWELPNGYGRVKPDILAYSQGVSGSSTDGQCTVLSGTSVASPVVTGALALLASSIPEKNRWNIINPASMKQILIEGGWLLSEANIYEQGYGRLNLLESRRLLQNYVPRVSFSPPQLDLTQCPYMWPFCSQPIYYTAMPLILNVTILNGMGVSGVISDKPQWIPGANGNLLEISFTYPAVLWPWTGYLAIYIRVIKSASNFNGTVEGIVRVGITSPPGQGETKKRNTTVDLPIKVQIIPTPHRTKRILWDQYHNLRYPSGYFPRDVLKMTDPFDWNGDHIHTNFKDLYQDLRNEGYFIEVLGYPFTCFDAANYGTLLIVDPEEEFWEEEIVKLHNDLEENDLSVIVIADWYNEEVIDKIKFLDENTNLWWSPVTGGSNLPALNDLLKKYHISFGKIVYDGKVTLGESSFYFASGAGIAAFPRDGYLIPFELSDQSLEITSEGKKESHKVPIIGLYQIPNYSLDNNKTAGRIVVFGDSSCLDSSNKQIQLGMCYWLMRELLLYSIHGDEFIGDYFSQYPRLQTDYVSQRLKLPERLPGNKLSEFSKVKKNKDPECIVQNFTFVDQTNQLVIVWKPTRLDGLFKVSNDSSLTRDNSIQIPYTLIIVGIVITSLIFLYFYRH